MQRLRRSLIPVVVAVAFVAAACGGGDDSSSTGGSGGTGGDAGADADDVGALGPSGEPQDGGTLRYALNAEANTYDPAASQWGSSGFTVARSIFDTLVAYDENDQTKPYLAESFEPDEDHTVWTITPREGVTFHNGEILTAELIAANIERYRVAPLLQSLFLTMDTVEVVDGTVVITLVSPWVNFDTIFTNRPGMMVPQEALDDPDAFGSSPIGTGPFVFESWVVDDKLTVTRNADYWNGPVHLDGIEFRVIMEDDSREAAMRAGEFDISGIFGAAEIIALEDRDAQVFVPEGESQEVLVLMNLDSEPLDDIRVREALVLAHNRQAQIDATGQGLYEPASGVWAPDSPWYIDTGYTDADPERARRLVEEYEAETGEQLAITLGSPQEPQTIRNMQFLQEEWAAVGIDVEIVPTERSEYVSGVLRGDYELAIWQFYDAPHPDGEYTYLHSSFAPEEGLAPNFGRIRDDALDAAFDAARAESDPEKQKESYAEVQQAMTDGFYMIWMYHDLNVLAARPEVGNVTEWSFPDGTLGTPFSSGVATKLTSVWLDQG